MVYEITEVPTPAPVTNPVDDIVATEVVTLLHKPPPVASVSVSVNVWHIGALPSIAVGCVFTVTIFVAAQLPIV